MKSDAKQTRIILDSIADGVFTVDLKWRITSFNRAAEKITGIHASEALGRHCWEVFKASICENRCALGKTLQTGRTIGSQSIFILNADGDRVPVSISTAILKDDSGRIIGGVETFRDLSEVEALRKELFGKHSYLDIVSKNEAIHRLFGKIELIAESNATVLIEGESGTGKELFAKAIHSLSLRKDGPMVTINCGSVPDTLLESELFGYKAGAFTDAKRDKPGRLALAEGGTLFLDEIGDVSQMMQVRLLRVLQDKIYEPLGSVASEKADVRIIAATNRNLAMLVKENKFREDLFYRINVVRLFLPPLRQRREDIPLLIEHFIRKFNRLIGQEIEGVAPDVMALLMAYDYPGNIRELENILEYATVICRDGLIDLRHLPENLQQAGSSPVQDPTRTPVGSKKILQTVEQNYLYEILKNNNWNRRATAAQMGIHPSTLWRKLKRLKVPIPSKDGRSRD